MDADLATTPERRDAWKHITETRIAFVATVSEDHGFHARPLTTQRVDDESTLWFFIAHDSNTASEARVNPRVLVTYANADDGFYASLSGRARVVVDPELARRMWSKLNEAWFPGGPDDPSLAILRIDVDHGESWEPTTNKMMQFLSIAAAAVTHTPPRNEGAHTILK